MFKIFFDWTYIAQDKIVSCKHAKQLPICFNSALGNFEVPHMLTVYENFKELGIFTIQEFLEAKISVKTKIDVDWFTMLDMIPLELLQIGVGEDPHPFSEAFRGILKPKNFMQLHRDINPFRNENAIGKWARDLHMPDIGFMWQELCLKSKHLPNKKLGCFHVEFLNRAFRFNDIVSLYSDHSPLCPSCSCVNDSYVHFFWECSRAQPIWILLIPWMEMLAPPGENDIDKRNCLLSNFESPLLINLSGFCKRYLYLSRICHFTATVNDFFLCLKHLRENHYNQCKYLRSLPTHFALWDVLIYDSIFLMNFFPK